MEVYWYFVVVSFFPKQISHKRTNVLYIGFQCTYANFIMSLLYYNMKMLENGKITEIGEEQLKVLAYARTFG